MASAPPNPTQLTPPRVAVIDDRTGAISREWYRFFLSLLTSTQNTSDAADAQPDTNSLMATYDAMLATVTQETQTNTSDLSASLQQQISDVFNATAVMPPSSGGTVTSVNASGGSTGLVFTGGPITTSGTLTLSGTLDVDNGGTGQTSYTDGQLLIGNTTGNTLTKATLTAGTAISITNAPGSISITNTAPDQIVSLTGAGTTVVTGTYPSFTITSNDAFVGTVTSVNLTAGTGISVSGGPITTSGSITVVNTAPDQIVSLTGAGTTSITGAYPSFTITSNDAFVGTVTSVSGTGTVNGITLTGTVTNSGSLTLGGTLSGVSLTSQVTGTLPVANGGTGTATAFTAGSIVFAGASGVYSQNNALLFWDNTNNRLGVGTATPGATFDVTGNIRLSASTPNIELNNGGPMLYSPAANTLSLATGGGPGSPIERFRIGPSGQWGIGGATYGTSGQVFSSGGAGAAPSWLTLATVATSGSFADLSNKPGIRSNGQNVINSSTTLGSADKGTNILIITSGITITFPSSGYASGEGVVISNVSGGSVTLSAPGGSDFGTTLPNDGTFFAFCDGGGFWRQYCYSTSRL